MTPQSQTSHWIARPAAAALLLSLALGCSLYKAQKAFDEGRYEDAIRAYQDLLKQDPANVKAKIGYRRTAALAAQQHINLAREAERRGQNEVVFQEVRKAVVLDPNNSVASDWLANLETEALRKRDSEDREMSLEAQRLEAEAKNVLQLNPRSPEGIDMSFDAKTSLREIFKTISKTTGINVLFHNSFPDATTSINLKGMNFQKQLDTLMLQNELFYKVLDPNTIMVFKSTQQNRDLYENTLLKTFYLSNADVDAVRNILQTLNAQMKIFVDKRLNAVTIKAKPNELAIAQRVVSQLDKSKPEVAVYLELLEVTENTMESVGLLPILPAGYGDQPYRLGVTLDNIGSINQNKGGIRISKSDLRFLFPSLTLDALKSSGDAKLVASPNVRVLSGEKAEVNIGEKVSTTQSQFGALGGAGTSTGTGTGAGTSIGGLGGLGIGGVNQSYGYEEVGVKITVEPRVHHDNTTTINITAEIKTLKSGSKPERPDLGQRIIKTSARLKDGETAVFAGLLKEEEQKSLQGLWGLTDVPVLGKLLGSNRKNKAKTDVILTIRSVLVRKPDLTKDDFEAFDPDMAKTEGGPFAPKKPAPSKPEGTVEPEPETTEPQASKGTLKRPVQPPASSPTWGKSQDAKSARPGGGAQAPSSEQPQDRAKPEMPRPSESATPARRDSSESTKPGAAPQAAEPATTTPELGELVLFITPLSNQIAKGERVRLSIMVSGGKGVDGGTLELRIDPKLKMLGLNAGDFILNEGGSFDTPPAVEGKQQIVFKRNGSATDSGTLASLELEALETGNAPVMIQSGRFVSGKNPLSGRWVNALVTVE